MANNTIIFPLIDSQTNPVTASRVILNPIYSTGSVASFPVMTISDVTGSAVFTNVQPNIYQLSYTPSNWNMPYNFISVDPTIVYVQIPVVTGTVTNGFVYIFTGSIAPFNSTGSSAFGTATQLNVDICSMANYIADQINSWAILEQGIAVVAENINEKVLPLFNNCVGPRCLIVYESEELWGDQATADLVGWAKRNFSVIIERGKILSDPRNSALVKTYGPSKPFYRLVEECRDTVRQLLFPTPMVYNPVMYNGMNPGKQNEKYDFLSDSYIISFSVLVQIPRISFMPPQLGSSDWVNLNGDVFLPNVSPLISP